MKKFLFDLFPLLLFFAAFKFTDDIFTATAVAIGAAVVQFAWLKLRRRRIEAMHWINLAVIVVFGGATLYFHNDVFIKWKPTVLYWLFGGVLLVGRWVFGRNVVRSLMSGQVSLPDAVWARMNTSWAGFFLVSGALNLYVAFSGNYTDAQWVNFKVFGLMILLIAFVIAQSVWLSRHMSEPEQNATPGSGLGQKEP